MHKEDKIILEKHETLTINTITNRYVVTGKDDFVVSCGDFIDTDYIEVKYNEEIEDEKR